MRILYLAQRLYLLELSPFALIGAEGEKPQIFICIWGTALEGGVRGLDKRM